MRLRADWSERVSHLLEEAFVGTEATEAFQRARDYSEAFSDDPGGLDQESLLEEVVERAARFRRASDPRPYWPQRRGTAERSPFGLDDVRRRFVGLVEELERAGYLAQAFPPICVDDPDPVFVDPSDVLQDRLGVPDLWPLGGSSERWDDDTFYGLIEVFHDLVVRPRHRWRHDWRQCGWHWGEFARPPGQALYRWQVNQLLEQSLIGLRLAGEGEDIGRLVAATDDARTELGSRMATRTDPRTGDRVRYALALFRARGATEHDKRSAIVTLCGVLEERRGLLKTELFRKDEGALFQIANEFAIRHQSETQKDDYNPAFLDWVFWWYLATVELTDRLLERQGLGAA
jgi:hypothetical protein